MNRVCLVGRITVKPELKQTTSGIATTKFNIAVNRQYTGNDGQRNADFIPIRVWRKQAENICKYLDKGSQVSVEGRLQSGSYQDKNGNKVYFLEVVADNVQFLENKKSGQISGQVSDTQTPQSDTEDPFADFAEEISIEDDNYLD